MGRISARTKILAIVLALLVVAAAIFFTVVFKVANETQPAVPSSYEKLEYNGVTYKPASYRINVLFMGIDEAGKAVSSGSYLNSGLADFLCLLSFDVRTKECVAIHINRDTITDVRMYGIGGKYLGKAPMQIALAHQYGDGLNDSCLNTAKAVSDLLKEIKIDYYVSLRMDAIPMLNDLVGGVEVTIEDDFSAVDPTLEMGKTIVLNGEQAETFVRGRKDVADQTNLSRMSRQKTYMKALYEKMTKGSLSFEKIYRELGEYIVTNCSTSIIERFSSQQHNYILKDIVSLIGRTEVVNGVMEFYYDEDALMKIVIENLYTPVK